MIDRMLRQRLGALFLSLLAPGLGHVRGGRLVTGLVLVGIGASLGPMAMLLGVLVPSAAPSVLIATAALFAIVWTAAAVDSFRRWQRRSDESYDRWYVYAVLAVVSLLGVQSWALALRENVVQAYRVPTASMLPAIAPGSSVLVDKHVYREGPVCRGDVVVLHNPNRRYQNHIKRVVALPGDTIRMQDDDLFVNGKKLDRDPIIDGRAWENNGSARYRILLGEPGPEQKQPSTFAEIAIPSGHCFVLGDNRRRSVDSRDYGPVPLGDLVGRAAATFRPRWERIAGAACGAPLSITP
jgi:signal peptidase I